MQITLDKIPALRKVEQRRPVARVELTGDVEPVCLDGIYAQNQSVGDLRVTYPLGNER